MTRVLIPYTSGRLQDGVFGAASASGYAVELHDVSGNESNYWRLISAAWREASADLVIVEHDVKVAKDTIAGFDECKRPWCCAGYPYLGGRHIGLGCVRFRRDLMREYPDALWRLGSWRTRCILAVIGVRWIGTLRTCSEVTGWMRVRRTVTSSTLAITSHHILLVVITWRERRTDA